MIYCILGQTCSGKTTLIHQLKNAGYLTIPLHTTRKQRYGEVEGEDYHFVSKEQYLAEGSDLIGRFTAANKEKMRFAVHAVYLEDPTDQFVIASPTTLKAIQEHIGEDNVISIYLNLDEEERMERGLERGDNIAELQRRIAADNEDYANVKADVVINSVNADHVFNQVLLTVGYNQQSQLSS